MDFSNAYGHNIVADHATDQYDMGSSNPIPEGRDWTASSGTTKDTPGEMIGLGLEEPLPNADAINEL